MAAPAADKYSEAEGVVETVIKIFSERTDPNTARDAGREICEIKRRATARHAELVRSIRESIACAHFCTQMETSRCPYQVSLSTEQWMCVALRCTWKHPRAYAPSRG